MLNDKENKEYYCEGFHNSLTLLSDNSIVLTGETPSILKDDIVNGIDFTEITKCSNLNNDFLFIYGDKLTLCKSDDFNLTVKYKQFDSNIIDILKLSSTHKYIIVSKNNKEFCFSISKYPLFKQNWPISFKTTKQFIGFSSVNLFSYIFVVIIIENQINLFEYSGKALTLKNKYKLQKLPIQITTFREYFLIGFEDEIKLYEIDYISHSEIKMNEVTSFLTQGSTSYISANNSFVFVCDAIQSIVLYKFDEKNLCFNEIARNCNDYGYSFCATLNDNIFASDYFGNLYCMKPSHSRNIDSYNINIYSSYSFKQSITFITSFSNNKILLSSQSGQYFEIVEFYPSTQLKTLYKEIESNVKSLGLFSSPDFRVVTKLFHPIKSENMFNLDLFQFFLDLSPDAKNRICSLSHISPTEADEMCRCTISHL